MIITEYPINFESLNDYTIAISKLTCLIKSYLHNCNNPVKSLVIELHPSDSVTVEFYQEYILSVQSTHSFVYGFYDCEDLTNLESYLKQEILNFYELN